MQPDVYQGDRSPHCPLVLTAAPGQSIQLTLFYFLSGHDVSPGSHLDLRHKRCTDVGSVRDGQTVTQLTVCQSDGRQTAVYTSKAASIELHFVTSSQQPWAYLLRYDGR